MIRLRPGALASAAAAAALVSLAFSPLGPAPAAAATPAAATPAAAAAAAIPAQLPLPSSAVTGQGSFATVPMGHLRQRLNTFWQLFFLPPAGGSWTDRVSGLGVATNGGIALAASPAGSVAVGVGPANLLRFSAVAETLDGGRSWSPAPPMPAKVEAIAAGGAASLLGLVAAGGGSVLASTTSEASWRPVVTARGLSGSAAGHRCGVKSITAVGYSPAGARMLGVSCAAPGIAGVFVQSAARSAGRSSARSSGNWRLEPVDLPVGARHELARVLQLSSTRSGSLAVLDLGGRGGGRRDGGGGRGGGGRGRRGGHGGGGGGGLAVAWSPSSNSASWSTSPVLSLGRSSHLVSFGPAGSKGVFVVASGGGSRKRLMVLGGPGSSWRTLPAPPPSTETVAVLASGEIDAFSPEGAVMTVWRLPEGARHWSVRQVLRLQIEYGSSS